jgi:hypothetical protein
MEKEMKQIFLKNGDSNIANDAVADEFEAMKQENKELNLKINELIEAIEMARDEAIDRREGRKIDYPNALEEYLTEVLERYE